MIECWTTNIKARQHRQKEEVQSPESRPEVDNAKPGQVLLVKARQAGRQRKAGQGKQGSRVSEILISSVSSTRHSPSARSTLGISAIRDSRRGPALPCSQRRKGGHYCRIHTRSLLISPRALTHCTPCVFDIWCFPSRIGTWTALGLYLLLQRADDADGPSPSPSPSSRRLPAGATPPGPQVRSAPESREPLPDYSPTNPSPSSDLL